MTNLAYDNCDNQTQLKLSIIKRDLENKYKKKEQVDKVYKQFETQITKISNQQHKECQMLYDRAKSCLSEKMISQGMEGRMR